MSSPPEDPPPPVVIARGAAADAETDIGRLLASPPEAMAPLIDDERQREARDGLVATLDVTLNPPGDAEPELPSTIEELERSHSPTGLGALPWSRHVRHADRLIRAALLDGDLELALRHLTGLGPASVVWPAVLHTLGAIEVHRPGEDPAVERGALLADHADARVAEALSHLDWREADEVGQLVRRHISAMSPHGGEHFEARRRELVDAYGELGEADRYRAAMVSAACSLHVVSVYHYHARTSDTAELGMAGWHRRLYEQETRKPFDEADAPIDLHPPPAAGGQR